VRSVLNKLATSTIKFSHLFI